LQVYTKINELYCSSKHKDVANMAEEGLALARELRSARAELAATIYCMLGDSFYMLCKHVKGLGLLEQARALAVEAGDRKVLGRVCTSLGQNHACQGEHAKAIAEYEQSLAIVVELGNRQGEGATCSNMGASYISLKEYDKAIELLEQSLAIQEELGDRSGQAQTRVSLGVCLSRHGQHDRAVACLKKAWAVFQQLGDAEGQTIAANYLGEALWAQARAEHHQAAPDATSCGGICAAGSETLQEAETWLRTALDLAVKRGAVSVRMHAQMHLACVAMSKGNEDEAVELLSQHLQGWLDSIGPHRCAGCGQVRGEDAPMLSCDGCRVARCVYARCHALADRHRLPCLP
jgi:tetratricopeptide (TPR) repeat protein